MKAFSLLFALSLLGTPLLAAADEFCGTNQEYLECGRSCPTCSNPNPPCRLECVMGCQCMRGYVLNDVGVIVLLLGLLSANIAPGRRVCSSDGLLRSMGMTSDASTVISLQSGLVDRECKYDWISFLLQ
ncbi:trypsin inhibitor-like cysteine-rich domain-containing protein [Aspergillus vadensis CBS 113365]|uniref:TIL domain-containing protein n=1 Tax=Aspergillus vadensis (strain CBS 113365 / IMI 142717 / IBT 24658) TaxID=1448311 RepID=A0A319B1W8_ASPVC|nr:hypothetical protein BO88DRAFT_417495 [Aspergillus vadensis CBS 113365]PYH66657.1 hypothetical protein BO88DRAFT_417495 [Aspergillus vadensis CBS 113365]